MVHANPTNQKWLLAKRPVGFPSADDFTFVEEPAPQPGPGEVLCKTLFMSLDPYMRGRMDDGPSYAPPVALGDVMTAETIGEVVISSAPGLQAGDIVRGRGGWQTYWLAAPEAVTKIETGPAPLSHYLGIRGMPGLTAYVGVKRIGQPKPGETLVVAAASGAVGAVVGQIAKRLGCQVVGIAGTAEKCRFLTEELGFDRAVCHRAPDFEEALARACPEGIDIYYENVGGPIFASIVPHLNPFARIAVCGLIAQYNTPRGEGGQGMLPAQQLMRQVLTKRLHIEGFIVTDYSTEMRPQFERDMAQWAAEKPFVYAEDVTDGMAQAPAAFLGMLRGENFGKALIKIS